jgi:ABC-type uncharacterized transport system ATPase subunit
MSADIPHRLIEARSLVKTFGEFTAVKAIDVEVLPGESFGFLGPNGAGRRAGCDVRVRRRGLRPASRPPDPQVTR